MTTQIEPRRVKRGWMNLRVSRIIDETADTKTFFLVDADEGGRPWDYLAAQYLTFRFDSIGAKPLVRSYTMSSSPRELDYSAVTVKRVEGGIVSNWLCDAVQVGDILRARGPIGKFIYDPLHDQPELYMIAAGSGVTPFVSILREFKDRLGTAGAPQRLGLLVAYKSRQDLILWDELQDSAKHAGVQLAVTLTRDPEAGGEFWQGRPDAAMLERFVGANATRATYMTCGPEALMVMTRTTLLHLGVSDPCIKIESFFS